MPVPGDARRPEKLYIPKKELRLAAELFTNREILKKSVTHRGAEHRGISALRRTDDVEPALQIAERQLHGTLCETGKERRDVTALHVEYIDACVHRGRKRYIQSVVRNRVLDRGRCVRDACGNRGVTGGGNGHVFAARGDEL